MEEARRKGLNVIKGDATHLLLDLDEDADVDFYEEMLPVVAEHIKLVEEKRWTSQNGGIHVQLRSPRPLSVRSRLLIQACLGSDRVKEFLSLVRVWKNEADPVMLFQPSVKKKPLPPPSPLSNVNDTSWLDDDVPF